MPFMDFGIGSWEFGLFFANCYTISANRNANSKEILSLLLVNNNPNS